MLPKPRLLCERRRLRRVRLPGHTRLSAPARRRCNEEPDTCDKFQRLFKKVSREPGNTAELKVKLDEGTYTWFCPIGDHRQRGMEGTVKVGAAKDAPEGDAGEGGSASGGASGY